MTTQQQKQQTKTTFDRVGNEISRLQDQTNFVWRGFRSSTVGNADLRELKTLLYATAVAIEAYETAQAEAAKQPAQPTGPSPAAIESAKNWLAERCTPQGSQCCEQTDKLRDDFEVYTGRATEHEEFVDLLHSVGVKTSGGGYGSEVGCVSWGVWLKATAAVLAHS